MLRGVSIVSNTVQEQTDVRQRARMIAPRLIMRILRRPHVRRGSFGCGLRPLIWACDVVTFSDSYGAARPRMVLGANYQTARRKLQEQARITSAPSPIANVTTAGPRRTVLDARLQCDTGGPAIPLWENRIRSSIKRICRTTCLYANTGLRGPRPVTALLVYTSGLRPGLLASSSPVRFPSSSPQPPFSIKLPNKTPSKPPLSL